jgi:hypothetical protein
MTDGIFINGRRPKSKKQIKETPLEQVSLEATSMFGNNPEGPLTELPAGTYHFVGPDPYSKRNFYGTIVVTERDGNRKVTIK